MKRKYLIMAFVLLLPQIVMASPEATINTNVNSIEKGKLVTATVTLTDTAAWNIKIAGSGAATCSSRQADVTSDGKSITKIFTLECKSIEEGNIKFTVTGDITSGEGQTKDISLTKDVIVTKPKSSDNTLDDLKVDGKTVSGFSSSKTSYTLSNNLGTSINITANASDAKAGVSGTGNKSLKYGKNTFNVTVTAENGSQKTYTIIVNKSAPKSNNNNLKSLIVSGGTIDFNNNTTSYTIKLEHDVNEINITAQAEDSKASVSGIGVKRLKDYVNEFKVIVKAENGSTKTYTIKAIRKDAQGNYGKLSTDNSVKSITIKNYDFKFNKEIKKYNILVDEYVNELEFNVVPNDSKATISIENNNNLKVGLNKVIIQVTAENGDINEFLFNVYKIGEEAIKEEIPVESEKSKDEVPVESEKIKEEKNSSQFNIWLIISGIEFIIIIILLLKRNKKGNNSTNSSNTSTNNTVNNNSDVEYIPKKVIDYKDLN